MTVLTDLFEDLRDAQEEMLRRARGQRFGQSFEGLTGGGMSKGAWVPTLDVAEREDAYLVTVELPGVAIGDLDISCQDGLMTIQGERRNLHEAATEKMHRAELRYGPFLRTVNLPSHVKADAIEATAADGVLQITVPKAQAAKPRRIQVHPGQAHIGETNAGRPAPGETTSARTPVEAGAANHS